MQSWILPFFKSLQICIYIWASCGALVVKNPPANAGDIRDAGSVPGLGKSPGGGHGNPLQYSCLEKPHGQRSLATLHGIAKSQTRLSKQSTAHKTIKMTLVRPLMTNFKVTVRADCAVSACRQPLPVYKSSCPDCQG